MRNEFSPEKSNPKINNSSMITAENSSLQSKFNIKKNKLMTELNPKYSNTILFEERQRRHPNTVSRKKNPKSIYLTDVVLTKYKETDFNTKTTLDATNMNYKTINNHFIPNNIKTKSLKTLLPNITNFSHKYINNPSCFTCCNQNLNPKFLTRLYNEQLINNNEREFNNFNINKKEKNIFKESKYEYIRKTNEIKRFKYEMDIKREALEDYKQNIKAQISGIDNTINNIKSYRDNLENNFIYKYNKEIRILERQLLDERLNNDKVKRELRILKNDISYLKSIIMKKENIIKNIEKWLYLQIYIKEGEKPKNLKNYLLKYNNQLIFETPEELDNSLKYRENKNLRLIEKYNRSEREKEKYINELIEKEKEGENNDQSIDILVIQKENILNSLKKREKSLKKDLNKLILEKRKLQKDNLNRKKRNKYSNHSYNNIHNKNSYYENDLNKNQLGILYKPIKYKNDIFNYIDCIFICILCNKINGLELNSNLLYQINNSFNITQYKKAMIQLKLIEISLNYLHSSINEKINSNKNNLIIMENTCKMIDLYHIKLNVEKNKLEQLNYGSRLMEKVEEKNNKIYYLPRGKIEKYNIVAITKKKDEENLKNKKVRKEIDIFDYLYDIYNN